MLRWNITTEMCIRDSYMELYALDITPHWNLTAQLAMKKTALNAHKLHLLAMLGNIEEIRYQQELQEQKTRVHDVLGQRIAMLQRALREEHMPVSYPHLTASGASRCSTSFINDRSRTAPM